ncbi:heat shock 70 kDa protein 12A-like [Mya arenaria]|nr:heat shock 70 kDa protein 12A-like [Mya arenaria]
MPGKRRPKLERHKTTLPSITPRFPAVERQKTSVDIEPRPAKFTEDKETFTHVAAIEIGTSYSGYAYAPRKEGKSVAKDIVMNQAWLQTDRALETLRTPACLLLNEKKEFEAYGYEAEQAYGQLVKDGKQNRCFYFRRFRHKLLGVEDLRLNSHITEENGKTMPALKVFSMSFRYLKSQLLNELCLHGLDISVDDFRWVITVAGFSDDRTKQFIRRAAEKAGLPRRQIILCLEPEAASLFCQNLPSNAFSEKIPILKAGAKYALADIGGGLTDIVMHEKKRDSIREVSRGVGAKLGGGSVDNIFLQFLYKLLGDKIAEDFVNLHRKDFLALMRDFENQKRNVTPLTTTYIELKAPTCLQVLCQKAQYNDNLANVIFRSVYKGRVKLSSNKLRIDAVVSNEFFRATTVEMTKIIAHSLTSLKTARDVPYLVLTGGFAESPAVQEFMNQELVGKTQIKQVIVPPDSDIAVLKGAVIYGNNPAGISSRVLRNTVGLRIARLFNPEMHPPDKKTVLANGTEYILDIFSPFLTIGTRVPTAFVSHQSLTTTEPNQKKVEIDIYSSLGLSHNFVSDEGCSQLGKIDYPIPGPSEEPRPVFVDVVLGDTEITVIVIDKKTQLQTKYYFPPLKDK